MYSCFTYSSSRSAVWESLWGSYHEKSHGRSQLPQSTWNCKPIWGQQSHINTEKRWPTRTGTHTTPKKTGKITPLQEVQQRKLSFRSVLKIIGTYTNNWTWKKATEAYLYYQKHVPRKDKTLSIIYVWTNLSMNIEINQGKKFKLMNCHVSVQHIKFKKKML